MEHEWTVQINNNIHSQLPQCSASSTQLQDNWDRPGQVSTSPGKPWQASTQIVGLYIMYINLYLFKTIIYM